MSDTVREMILLVVGTFLIVGACMLTRIPYIIANHRDNLKALVVGTFLIVLACILIQSPYMIIANHRDDLKAEAVKRGFAEWVSDYNGNTAFKWKEGVK
jgi:hypothetical protein